MKAIEQILAVDNLTGLIKTVASGVPESVLPPGFFSVTERFLDNQGSYHKVQGTRATARLAMYGGPARLRGKIGIAKVPVTLAHTYEHMPFQAMDLINLMAEDSPVRQDMGRQTVTRQIAEFGQLFRNLRVSCVYSAFSKGAINFDGEGNLLPSSDGAAVTVDFGVSAAHKDQLGGIIAADWDEATTDIPSQIEALKKGALQATGYELKHAFYGQNVCAYLTANNYIGSLMKASPSLSEQVAIGNAIPQGLMGLQWHQVSDAFFVDSGGTVREWFGADQIVFTPEPAADWWGFIEGGYIIPRSIEVAGDIMGALSSLQQITGAFSYAVVAYNPPGATHYAGDTFLPVLKNPDAIYIADVKAT